MFSTYTERAKVLQDLRQGVIPTSMWSRFPDVVCWRIEGRGGERRERGGRERERRGREEE